MAQDCRIALWVAGPFTCAADNSSLSWVGRPFSFKGMPAALPLARHACMGRRLILSSSASVAVRSPAVLSPLLSAPEALAPGERTHPLPVDRDPCDGAGVQAGGAGVRRGAEARRGFRARRIRGCVLARRPAPDVEIAELAGLKLGNCMKNPADWCRNADQGLPDMVPRLKVSAYSRSKRPAARRVPA